jgi:hypothetical protein
MKRTIRRMGGLSILALLVGSASVASAQVAGSWTNFNILANTAVSLTGVDMTNKLYVPVVGIAPNTALTKVRAVVGTEHLNDTTAVTGQLDATALNTSIDGAVPGATIINQHALSPNTLPGTLNPGAGVTVYQWAGQPVTNNSTTLILTAGVADKVIFQVGTALTLTDVNIVLAGGLLAGNVYWQVGTGVTVVNDDAATRSFPGTVVLNGAAANIAVTSSGAGALNIGRLISRNGAVTVVQSGAGTLTVANPIGGTGGGSDAPAPTCGPDYFWPSPATGPTGNFQYCMARSGHAIIKVYNAIGDIVAKLDDHTSGCTATATAAFTCLSPLNTGRLAPGVYLYRVQKFYDDGTSATSSVKKFGVKH